jgi:hypothetical protein
MKAKRAREGMGRKSGERDRERERKKERQRRRDRHKLILKDNLRIMPSSPT